MTPIAPGYYWIRWPITDRWKVWSVVGAIVYTLGEKRYLVDDFLAEVELRRAELGPRIEPPCDR